MLIKKKYLKIVKHRKEWIFKLYNLKYNQLEVNNFEFNQEKLEELKNKEIIGYLNQFDFILDTFFNSIENKFEYCQIDIMTYIFEKYRDIIYLYQDYYKYTQIYKFFLSKNLFKFLNIILKYDFYNFFSVMIDIINMLIVNKNDCIIDIIEIYNNGMLDLFIGNFKNGIMFDEEQFEIVSNFLILLASNYDQYDKFMKLFLYIIENSLNNIFINDKYDNFYLEYEEMENIYVILLKIYDFNKIVKLENFYIEQNIILKLIYILDFDEFKKKSLLLNIIKTLTCNNKPIISKNGTKIINIFEKYVVESDNYKEFLIICKIIFFIINKSTYLIKFIILENFHKIWINIFNYKKKVNIYYFYLIWEIFNNELFLDSKDGDESVIIFFEKCYYYFDIEQFRLDYDSTFIKIFMETYDKIKNKFKLELEFNF